MITKKKKGEITDTFKVVDDIIYGFDCLISQTQKNETKSNIIKFDINYTNSKHTKDLHFKLTNKVFNSLHKQFYYEKLNYLFVIENNEILSRGNYLIDDLDEVRYDGPHSSNRIFILLRYDFYSKYPVLKNWK